jgi:hypothetical protein
VNEQSEAEELGGEDEGVEIGESDGERIGYALSRGAYHGIGRGQGTGEVDNEDGHDRWKTISLRYEPTMGTYRAK